jgi:predicted PurR-regulated permease PerM
METYRKNMPLVLVGLCGILLVASAFWIGAIFLPLLIALILAYLMDPLVERLVRWRMNRTLSILFIFLLVLVGGGLILAFLFMRLRTEVAGVQINLPEYANRLYAAIPPDLKLRLDIETPEKVYQHMNAIFNEMRSGALGLLKEAFALLTRAFASTLGLVLAVLGYFITPVYLFYFLKDLPEIRSRLEGMIPLRYRVPVAVRMHEINEVLSAFVRGQLLVCVFLAVMYSLGFAVIGIDLGVFIGTLSGFAFIIPYFGTFLGIVLSTAMAALKFHDLLHPLLCVVWIGFVQAIESGIITPKIVGDKVGIHPVIAILALFIGGQLFGILGMLLAIPAAAVLKVFLVVLLERYRRSAFYSEA